MSSAEKPADCFNARKVHGSHSDPTRPIDLHRARRMPTINHSPPPAVDQRFFLEEHVLSCGCAIQKLVLSRCSDLHWPCACVDLAPDVTAALYRAILSTLLRSNSWLFLSPERNVRTFSSVNSVPKGDLEKKTDPSAEFVLVVTKTL